MLAQEFSSVALLLQAVFAIPFSGKCLCIPDSYDIIRYQQHVQCIVNKVGLTLMSYLPCKHELRYYPGYSFNREASVF